jgi:Protein of unknown function (DUF4012)
MFIFKKKPARGRGTRPGKKSNKLAIILSVIVILFILIFYCLWTIRYIVWQMDELGNVVVSMANDFSSENFDLQTEKLMLSSSIINDIQNQLDKMYFISFVPGISGVYYDLRDVFSQTEQIFGHLVKLNDELSEISSTTDGGITSYLLTATPDQVNLKISSVVNILNDLEGNLSHIVYDIDSLANIIVLRSQKDTLLELNGGLANLGDMIGKIGRFINLGPELFGYPEPVNYLLLLQNNHEMRATGGFIGSYGILSMHNGQIADFFIDDIYHLDSEVIGELEIDPPAPIRKYLDIKYWYMRDSNWSPDFPTSAMKAIEFYRLEGGQEDIDVVVAVSPDVVGDLLTITGEMFLENVLYQSENFTNILQYEVEQNYASRSASHWERKEVIGDLANLLVKEMHSLPLDNMFDIVDIVYNNLATKDLQIYSLDNETQDYLIEQNWAGELLASENDFLMVVDSNMAAFKTNQHIDRSINYYVQEVNNPVGEDYYIATTEIYYEHSGDFAWDTTRYRTYTRIYVPQGSVLTSWSGTMADDRTAEPGVVDISQEKEKTVFGAFIAIEPGENGSLIFQYRLPDFDDGNYDLLFQHQAGMEDNLSVRLFGEQTKNYIINSDLYIDL